MVETAKGTLLRNRFHMVTVYEIPASTTDDDDSNQTYQRTSRIITGRLPLILIIKKTISKMTMTMTVKFFIIR